MATESPTPQPSFLRFIVDRNPFFLISALLMFAGCRLIVDALGPRPGAVHELLLLLGTLQVYEALLITIALLLIRRGQQRDGWILLFFQSLFLVDLVNLSAEVFTSRLGLGAVVNGGLLLLAIIKVSVILRILKLRISMLMRLLIFVQLAVLLAMPGIYKSLSHEGAISAVSLYAGWWVIAVLVAAATLFARPRAEIPFHPMNPLPLRLYVVVPLLSLLVHLCGMNRVYAMEFQVANVSPIVLAMAVIFRRRPNLYLFAPLAALYFAFGYGSDLTFGIGHDLLRFTPTRLIVLGMMLIYVDGYVLHRRYVFLVMITTAALGGILHITMSDLVFLAQGVARWVGTMVRRLIPHSQGEWGVFSIIASFLTLAVGAAMSLLKRHPPPLPVPAQVSDMQP